MQPLSGVAVLRGPALRHFVRHYLEMVIAMVVGMMVLAPLWTLLSRGLERPELRDRTELLTLTMATDMTLGMAAWMRYRGHSWRPIAEMGAAMFVPFIILFVPLWAGLISEDALMIAGHAVMLVAMLVVMLARPQEYAGHHHTAVSSSG
jgi:peptidoglycan/LPS O-acetylase OafA/YrhL